MGKYMSETAKDVRYDKIQAAIESQIHKLADQYRETADRVRCDHDEDGNWHEWHVSETQIDDESYEWACEKLLEKIEDTFDDEELYWIVDIMLEENFDHKACSNNPYAVHKTEQKKESKIGAELTPFGIMFNIK